MGAAGVGSSQVTRTLDLRMKRILITALLLIWASAGYGVPGDLNRDSVVDFDDFFIFADNFGMEGSPDVIDTVEVTIFDTLTVQRIDSLEVTVYDTLVVEIQHVVYDTLVIDHATVFDTVIFGREEIRFAPPPPPSEINQSLTIRSSLLSRRFLTSLTGEIANTSSASLKYVSLRLTVRDPDGLVIHLESDDYSINRLVAGDTRIFQTDLYGEEENVLDNIRAGNYSIDVAWSEEIEQVNNVSIRIREGTIQYASPFAIMGEVENTTDLTVRYFTIHFYGRDSSGNPTYYTSYSEDTFGIPPGGTAPFSVDKEVLDMDSYLGREEIAELYYYISA